MRLYFVDNAVAVTGYRTMVFPFTFTLRIPGLSNPFTSRKSNQTPIVSTNGPDMKESRAVLQKITRPRPCSSPSLSPAPLSRKRGWEPSPSRSTTTLTSTTGYLDTPAKYRQLGISAISDEYHNITMSDSPPDQGYNDQEEGALQPHILDLGACMQVALHNLILMQASVNVFAGAAARGLANLRPVETAIYSSSPISIQHILSSLFCVFCVFCSHPFRYLLSSSLLILYLFISIMATNRLILLLHIEMPPLKRRRGLAGSIISTAISAALIGSAVGLTVYRL